jgi:hypothetical protein
MKKEKKTTTKSDTKFDFRTIKTFEDACKKENVDPEKLPDVSMIPESFQKAIVNCYKLFIIFKAINNDWVANWNDYYQNKYYPWFRVLSSGSGFDFSNSNFNYDHSRTGTLIGSRLCTDSSEKALYIGKQFGEEYAEFFLIKE